MLLLKPQLTLWNQVIEQLERDDCQDFQLTDVHGEVKFHFDKTQFVAKYFSDCATVLIPLLDCRGIRRFQAVYHELIHREQWYSQNAVIIEQRKSWKEYGSGIDFNKYYKDPLEQMAHAGAYVAIEHKFRTEVEADPRYKQFSPCPEQFRNEEREYLLYVEAYRASSQS